MYPGATPSVLAPTSPSSRPRSASAHKGQPVPQQGSGFPAETRNRPNATAAPFGTPDTRSMPVFAARRSLPQVRAPTEQEQPVEKRESTRTTGKIATGWRNPRASPGESTPRRVYGLLKSEQLSTGKDVKRLRIPSDNASYKLYYVNYEIELGFGGSPAFLNAPRLFPLFYFFSAVFTAFSWSSS
jgi:hypothetical protein